MRGKGYGQRTKLLVWRRRHDQKTTTNTSTKDFQAPTAWNGLAYHGADMERLTGLDVRTIREHIRQLIVDYGIPVCGGRDNKLGGYYIPQNETERLAGVLPLQKQYDQEHKRIHALLTADLQDWRRFRDV
ncbi:DNA-binding protein [Streptococcus suis]|uniref:DNA-binding protein n=1 Tax=Streptococcus suis TaxID=1307 RepID=UPI001F5C3F6A|nr:DNA-binding protein [Streptococcus suis]